MSKWAHKGRVHNRHPEQSRHSMADIQHQGREAFKREETQQDNPYEFNTDPYKWWLQGFLIEFGNRYFHQEESPDGIGA